MLQLGRYFSIDEEEDKFSTKVEAGVVTID